MTKSWKFVASNNIFWKFQKLFNFLEGILTKAPSEPFWYHSATFGYSNSHVILQNVTDQICTVKGGSCSLKIRYNGVLAVFRKKKAPKW